MALCYNYKQQKKKGYDEDGCITSLHRESGTVKSRQVTNADPITSEPEIPKNRGLFE